jgi:phenylpropionate dioxygenase-like ring-hydroxylating dioxygenase large terminal subunit
MNSELVNPDNVRKDFIPKECYVSREFLELENKYLWPRVWQMACREEELVSPGQYVTYEVANETIVILRGEDRRIRAFHNVCPHRGRRLTSGCGHASQLVCRFHGWRFSLSGKCTHISDRNDWGQLLDYQDANLTPVKVEVWGGFVFIHMDLNAEPLEKFLEPFNTLTGRFEYEKLRFSWYRTSIAPCNWKIAHEAFSEQYHIQQSHAQMLQYYQDYSKSGAYGRHGAFWGSLPEGAPTPFAPSFRLNKKADPDARKYVVKFLKDQYNEIRSLVSERTRDVQSRILAEVDAGASPQEVAMCFAQFQREAAESDGAGWPQGLDPEYLDSARSTWILFPNFIMVHAMVDCMLVYRARPNGDDPNSCIFDVWSLTRYAPGKEPPLKREFYKHVLDADWGLILRQDFEHFEDVQRGLRSSFYQGHRPNPVQEVAITNFQRALREFIVEGMRKDAA